jgi:hypothetical protein
MYVFNDLLHLYVMSLAYLRTGRYDLQDVLTGMYTNQRDVCDGRKYQVFYLLYESCTCYIQIFPFFALKSVYFFTWLGYPYVITAVTVIAPARKTTVTSTSNGNGKNCHVLNAHWHFHTRYPWIVYIFQWLAELLIEKRHGKY